MKKEFSLIKEFVTSLESNMLSKNQQAVLLVGESDDFWGGFDTNCTNYGCLNGTPDCASANNSSCVNTANCKCIPSNTSNCGCSDTACQPKNTNCPCPSKDTACQTNPNTQNGCGDKGLGGYSMLGFPGFDMF